MNRYCFIQGKIDFNRKINYRNPLLIPTEALCYCGRASHLPVATGLNMLFKELPKKFEADYPVQSYSTQ